MSEPPEFWMFAIANLVTFVLGVILTGLSFYAYRENNERRSLRTATIGFGLLTMGMVVEPVYQLGFKGGYELAGRELLALQTLEGIFLATGLGMLFFSIYRYNTGRQQLRQSLDEYVREGSDETQ